MYALATLAQAPVRRRPGPENRVAKSVPCDAIDDAIPSRSTSVRPAVRHGPRTGDLV